jgi:hypothetical protein
VVDRLICDGHHRYLASILANYSIGRIKSVKTSAMNVIPWESIFFEENDWDTDYKIKMLNEQDAVYNNIPLDELNALLKEDVPL